MNKEQRTVEVRLLGEPKDLVLRDSLFDIRNSLGLNGVNNG